MMPVYTHHCRDCDTEWNEEYSLEEYDRLKAAGENLVCVQCESQDTYRCVTTSRAVHFKGGGWSGDGYYKYHAYDQHKAEGKGVKLYDNKEDIERDMKGEKAEATKRRLKQEDAAAKRAFGPDAGMSQAQADERIKKEVAKVKVEDGSGSK